MRVGGCDVGGIPPLSLSVCVPCLSSLHTPPCPSYPPGGRGRRHTASLAASGPLSAPRRQAAVHRPPGQRFRLSLSPPHHAVHSREHHQPAVGRGASGAGGRALLPPHRRVRQRAGRGEVFAGPEQPAVRGQVGGPRGGADGRGRRVQSRVWGELCFAGALFWVLPFTLFSWS